MNRAEYVEIYGRLSATRTKFTECVRITRTDGLIMRFTALDMDLSIQEEDGAFYTYKSADSFKLTAIENQIGLAVSNMDVDVLISDDAITEGELIAGLYDHANVELYIAYWAGLHVGLLPLRTSWIGELTLKGVTFRADLRGIAQKLQQMFISTTSLECRYSFCDHMCGLDKATYTRNVTINGVESNDTFSVSGLPGGDRGKLKWGLATWITGNNAGGQMEIIRNHVNRIQLFLPMPFNIDVGDQLEVLIGCDKVFKTCNTEFNNSRRFGGEPFIVGSDMLKTYPKMIHDEEDEGGKF